MKKLLPFSRLLPLFALLVLSNGCMKDKMSKTYQIMRPVYAQKSAVLDNIKAGPVMDMKAPGKIFIRGSYLFINEVNKGIHIYNNSNPTSPTPVSFISIPGNMDIAVSGHYLYADMFTDMITIDIEDPLQAKMVDTSMNVFPERSYYNGWQPASDLIIVDWIMSDTTIFEDDINREWMTDGGSCAGCNFLAVSAVPGSQKANYVPGIAGSMSRFVVVNNYLYAVNNSSLIVYDINDQSNPERRNEQYLGWQIETVYPFANNLFIGSAEGMFIFNIDNPALPERKGSFAHARTCDPVVSDGDYAYVTLRSGNSCAGNLNQLDILDVSNVMSPQLVKTYPMNNPFGLGKDGDLLFICDGDEGVKVYDAGDVRNLKLINTIRNIDAFDVIPWANKLIISATEGIYQYDYSDHDNIRLLSTIRIEGR